MGDGRLYYIVDTSGSFYTFIYNHLKYTNMCAKIQLYSLYGSWGENFSVSDFRNNLYS